MSNVQIQQVLASMRALSARAGSVSEDAPRTGGVGFGNVLKQSLAEVNATQQRADVLASRFEQGDPHVNLDQVMVSMQKASLEFEAATQVRNRLIAAYQDIMNMQV